VTIENNKIRISRIGLADITKKNKKFKDLSKDSSTENAKNIVH